MSDTPADGPPRPWTAPTPLGPLDATVALPGSKSLTSRALLLAAVADGPTTITGVPPSRDTGLMVAALETLGARFNEAGGRSRLRAFPAPLPLHVATGPDGTGHVDCGLAGTVMRFVPPLAALADAPVVFDGDEAARRRPLGPLLDALAALGARTLCLAEPGHLPVRVEPGGGALLRPCDPAPGTPHRVGVDASESSQLLSALLLVGALLPGGLAVTPTGRVPSLPHIAMTAACLRERGVPVEEPGDGALEGARTWIVHPARPAGGEVTIEPDLSNAGPFLAAALIAGGEVRVPHWPMTTTQGGDAWRELLPRLGGSVELRAEADGSGTLVARGTGAADLRGIDADLSAVGELAPGVAALAALASAHGRPSRLRGIAHLRGHETNRLTALVAEIARIGGRARESEDGIVIDALPAGARLHPALLHSHADHRMATFAALIGLGVKGTELDDIECTSKTLPDFPALWTAMLSHVSEHVPGQGGR